MRPPRRTLRRRRRSGLGRLHHVSGEIWQTPRSWAETAYPTLNYFHQAERGGHFAAWEEPALFAAELRAGFQPTRPARS